ncbi:TonB C-terminal domain-containing protein [Geminisphaera colitermitum]|uniref:TonB C-terminal domain-containing protein n=1 Tax=Geminisphaera colitermitum TaxID=1148786 RepID=UPI001E409517|nr:TonB C-terminal domain-containing protein [Geminisphaera colitermitum]
MADREPRPMRKVPPVERVVAITAPRPLPPPPPRPPEPQPRPEQAPRADEMIVQEPVTAQDQPPPDAPASEPDNALPGPVGEAMGTNIQGDGSPNAFGLSGRGGGGIIGGGGGGGRGGGSRWGWYASHVQSRIERALQDNDKTRTVGLDINVRLWTDTAGRITHVQLVGTTGDAELDRVLRRDVLAGLVMREPPPVDMPQPILIRILGLRPN